MLAKHLREAIAINKKRRKIYIKLSNGKSKTLSNKLIFFEKLLILPAMIFDKKAKRFNKKGIPILQNDFVSMNGLPQPETPPIFTNKLPKKAFKELKQKIKKFKTSVTSDLKTLNFEETLKRGKELYKLINIYENKFGCHLAMTKHVTESLNLIVHNGIKYREMSKGKTVKITKVMIKGHLSLLIPCLKTIDIHAQKLHKIKCGIIVNDMPEIPLPK